jgi:plastocyanin
MPLPAGGRRALIGAVLLLSAVLGGRAAIGAGAAGAAPASHTVMMDSSAFSPRSLTVKLGDSVVWVNTDPFPHTATSRTAKFDSRRVPAGGSWTYRTERKGTFDYVCTLHPGMKGTLTVE